VGAAVAKPDTDDGFAEIASELLLVVLQAKLTARARMVLGLILNELYGPHKPRHARIDRRRIAELSGLGENVRHAIKELVDWNIVRKFPGDSFAFHRDYDTWRDARGEKLIGDAQAAVARYAQHYPGRAVSRRKGRVKADTAVSKLTRIRVKADTPSRVKADTDSCQRRHAPLKEELNTAQQEGVVVGDAGASGAPFVRPLNTDPAEVDRVAAWAEALAPMDELGAKVRDFATSYPLPWIEAALLCGLASAQAGHRWRYAHGCLRRWYDAGGPDRKEVAIAQGKAPEASAAPRRPSSRIEQNNARVRETLAQLQAKNQEANTNGHQ
jgi:hypothetical protein